MSTDNFSPTPQPFPTIKLWMPNAISVLILFLGFPGGTVLASINWYRMKMRNKAIASLFIGIIAMVVLVAFPITRGLLFIYLINIGILTYLWQQMKLDIEKIKITNHRVQNAHWFGGSLISLATLAIFLAVGVFFSPDAAYYRSGNAHLAKDEYDLAIADYTKVIDLEPKNNYPYLRRGVAYTFKEDYERAIADFNTAIQLNPNNDLAYLNRGFVYEFSRRPHEAIQDFEKVLEITKDPDKRKMAEGELQILKSQ